MNDFLPKAHRCVIAILILLALAVTPSYAQSTTSPTTSGTSLSLDKVREYLKAREKNTTLQNERAEKALIGQMFEGEVSVANVFEQDGAVVIIAQVPNTGTELTFAIKDQADKEKAAALTRGTGLHVTAQLTSFVNLGSGYINVPDTYRAKFEGKVLFDSLQEKASTQATNPPSSAPNPVDPDVAKQLERLNSKDATERAQGAINLGNMFKRAKPATPKLVELLGDATSLEWRTLGGNLDSITSPGAEAALALVKIEDADALDPLSTALNQSTDSWHQVHLINAIGRLHDPRVPKVLIDFLKREQSEWTKNGGRGGVGSSAAIKFLAPYRDKESIDPLFFILRHGGDDSRPLAARALVDMGEGDNVIIGLIRELRDVSPDARSQAAHDLGNFGDSRTVQPLIDCLNDDNQYVVDAAIRSLSDLNDARALAPLNNLIAAINAGKIRYPDPSEQAFILKTAREAVSKLTKLGNK